MPGTKSPKVTKACKHCFSSFKTTEKRAWRTHFCSKECQATHTKEDRQSRREARKRECMTCGKYFYPRWPQIKKGDGKYCSIKCSFLPRQKEMTAKGNAKSKQMHADGLIKFPTGPQNKQWKGGIQAYRSRETYSGRAAKRLRDYRKANPHKVREWSQTRKGRKTGRLPRGTIPNLYEMQKGLCVLCGITLENGYHMDHIFPLSKGGKHAPENIQLLCQSCNVRKSAKILVKTS